MSKSPLETCVYIVVKCMTFCRAVSTQVSHTISPVHVLHHEAKQWQHKTNKSGLPTPRVTPKVLRQHSAAAMQHIQGFYPNTSHHKMYRILCECMYLLGHLWCVCVCERLLIEERQFVVPFPVAVWHFCWAVVTHVGCWWQKCWPHWSGEPMRCWHLTFCRLLGRFKTHTQSTQ